MLLQSHLALSIGGRVAYGRDHTLVHAAGSVAASTSLLALELREGGPLDPGPLLLRLLAALSSATPAHKNPHNTCHTRVHRRERENRARAHTRRPASPIPPPPPEHRTATGESQA